MSVSAKRPDWSKRLFWLLLTVLIVIVVLVYLASQTLIGMEQ